MTGDDTFYLLGGAFLYFIFGLTPVPYLSIAMFRGIFTENQKFHEKFLIVLGGTPVWGLYVVLVSAALDRWLYKDDILSCVVWLSCLHFIYIWNLFDKISKN